MTVKHDAIQLRLGDRYHAIAMCPIIREILLLEATE